ncbi:phage/plasmid primase, P4 family [Facklamia sp. P9177]|uniref:phage/plasmid primase, P4 family n=1 Tax=Facklamia sp. P9177 TaxID=3421945 RepID=UPI003D167A33
MNQNKVILENIPQELKDMPRWVAWNYEERNGKITKVPYDFYTGFKASSNDPDTWCDFDTAVEYLKHYDGLGFQLGEGIFGIDIDAKDNQELQDYLNDGINNRFCEFSKLGTYAEISPSGNGVHYYFKGNLPGKGFKNSKLGVEAYESGRFFTVTGNMLGNYPNLIDGSEIIKPLYEKYRTKKDSPVHLLNNIGNGNTYEINKLIELASKSKNGEKFKSLFFEGDTSSYNHDDSAADQALANILVWWCNHDLEKANEMFRQSKLYRDKWDSKRGSTTYGMLTLSEASRVTNGGFTGKFEFKFKDSLELRLRIKGEEALEELIQEWEIDRAEGSTRKKPNTLPPVVISNILQDEIVFIKFAFEENSRVAMYQETKGIYTQNLDLIRHYIKIVDRNSTRRSAEEVIYDLTHTASVKEKTVSRFLIPVNNGVFNLKTKELEPFTPDYVFTSKIATNYIQGCQKPIIDGWDIDKWLLDIAVGDEQITELLWQVISASLNGNYSRKKSIWLVGSGRNAKGTYQELITNLVGFDNVATLKIDQFGGKDNNRFNLSLLEEKVVCIGDDVPAGVFIDNSSDFNSVVTGDAVKVERKNMDAYSTRFNLTIIQSTNGLPKIHNKTEGTYRRFLIVPFNAKFTDKTDNSRIKDEYIKNQKVLEYVLYKAINLDFDKFIVPDISAQLLEDFKQDNDPLVDFKENVFDQLNVDRIPTYIVYAIYKEFCNENGFKFLSKIKFTKELTNLLKDTWEKKVAKVGSEKEFYKNLKANFDMPIAGSAPQHFVKIN